ncbi:dTMP kinase [Candidatus Phytoplasma sacchari]|uniref:Thymidylate kinase n=1 Tax=Candidatus Phytoplasma sacchari TaxID=2609813 RepID=A0ABY7M2I9_9MOLU|nr:dTMP kinase [Candidatus Phytoplasma sacchari]KAB8122843.1 dTMP kinase [Candidatus Phytoplasma sacchari]WBL31237.1 dTMP kinase [Candidatus Phytoplasma sacchari]
MFISFEGCEGSGKTTLANYLFSKIFSQYPVILTKEPGGIENDLYKFNILIKKLLLKFNNKIDYYTEALLYAANRVEHLKKVIIPSLKEKKIVICDRYIDSSFAYQGYARGLGKKFIHNINKFACKYYPNITFYLDLEPEIGLERIKTKRKDKIEYFDLQNIEFHKKVREGYLKICKQYPKRIYKINANHSLDSIKEIIEFKIKNNFKIKI